jgi:hypothetical protein
MMSRIRRQCSACIGAALIISVALSGVTPAQARPPEHHPNVQSASGPSTRSATPGHSWFAPEQTASLPRETSSFWGPIYALVMAWKSAIGTLITHVWKGGDSDSEVCR